MSNRNTTGYIKTWIFCSRDCAFQPLKNKEKDGITFFFFWLDFLYLNRTTSNSNCQSTRVWDISEITAKRTVSIFFNTKYKHCGVYTWPEKIVLVYQINFRKKQHARENKYLPFNG